MKSKNFKKVILFLMGLGLLFNSGLAALAKDSLKEDEIGETLELEEAHEIVELEEEISENVEETIEIDEKLEVLEETNFRDNQFDPSKLTIDFSVDGEALIQFVPVSDELYIPGQYDFEDKGIRRIMIDHPKVFKNKVKHLVIEEVNGVKVGVKSFSLYDGFADENTMITADLRGLDVSTITHMNSLFSRNSSLVEANVDGWDTSNVVDMSYMFYYASKLEEMDLNSWDVSNVKTMQDMFSIANSLHTIHFADWQLDNVEDMSIMFYDSPKLRNVDVSKWKMPKAKTMYGMFWLSNNMSIDISEWDVSSVETMRLMFYQAQGIKDLDLSKWDVSQVYSFEAMFAATDIESLNLDNWDTSRAITMDSMFSQMPNLKELKINHFNTENVESMYSMFLMTGLKSLDLSQWDVSKVNEFDRMFENTPNLEFLNFENWSTKASATKNNMYKNSLNGNVAPIKRLVITSDPEIKAYDFAAVENSPLLITSFKANTLEDDGQYYGQFEDGDSQKNLTLKNVVYDKKENVDLEIADFIDNNKPIDERLGSDIQFSSWKTTDGELPINLINRYLENGKEIFEAQWFTAMIMYDANTDDKTLTGTTPNNQPFAVGDSVTVSSNTGNLERLGYKFVGWAETAVTDEDSVIYGTGLNQEINITPNFSTTLYAVWKAHNQTIIWNSNNGLDPVETIQSTGSEIKVIEDPILEGYTFVGWYQNEELTDEIPLVVEALDENTEINFYAKYKKNEEIVEPESPEDLKDKTPETGINHPTLIVVLIASTSLLSLLVLKKKNVKE